MTTSEILLTEDAICGPHCDQRILHAPGVCDACDEFPTLQKARMMWEINFTGETGDEAKTKTPCLADAARGDSHQNWRGNRAYKE